MVTAKIQDYFPNHQFRLSKFEEQELEEALNNIRGLIAYPSRLEALAELRETLRSIADYIHANPLPKDYRPDWIAATLPTIRERLFDMTEDAEGYSDRQIREMRGARQALLARYENWFRQTPDEFWALIAARGLRNPDEADYNVPRDVRNQYLKPFRLQALRYLDHELGAGRD